MRTYFPPFPDDLPEDVRTVLRFTEPAYGGNLVERLGEGEATMKADLEPFVHPGCETELSFIGEKHHGLEGLFDAWRELLSVFTAYRPNLDEVVDMEDGRVALFGHDSVATHEGIELDIPVGAIYELQDGLVRRARFFPDQAGARSALAER